MTKFTRGTTMDELNQEEFSNNIQGMSLGSLILGEFLTTNQEAYLLYYSLYIAKKKESIDGLISHPERFYFIWTKGKFKLKEDLKSKMEIWRCFFTQPMGFENFKKYISCMITLTKNIFMNLDIKITTDREKDCKIMHIYSPKKHHKFRYLPFTQKIEFKPFEAS